MTGMKALRVIAIRHGATELTQAFLNGAGPGAADPPLDERGRRQVGLLAEHLAGESPVGVWCSPARRAAQTAAALGWTQAQSDDRLAEVDFGEWEGRAPAELVTDERYRRWWDDPDMRAPGGTRSLAEVNADVRRWLAARQSDCAGETIAAVGHASTVRVLVAGAIGLPVAESTRLTVLPAGAAVLRFWPDGGSTLDAFWAPGRTPPA